MKKIWTPEKIKQITLLYEGHSKKEICEIMGISEASARQAMSRLGLNTKRDDQFWTEEQISELKEIYKDVQFSEQLDLVGFAKKHGKHKTNVCRKAKELGLTNQKRATKVNPLYKRPRMNKEQLSKHISQRTKRWFELNPHPRGMKGKKHTKETKDIISQKSAKFNASLTAEQKSSFIIKAMKAKERNGTLNRARKHGSWKAAWRNIGGYDKYYRSIWEANYARYLQWLKENGHIKDWKHEPETFWFEGIKRGSCSYLPDFWVLENNGSEVYHEVKGWMDDRSKTKIKRMAKYHPNVKLIIIDSAAYTQLKKSMSGIIDGWEFDSKGR